MADERFNPAAATREMFTQAIERAMNDMTDAQIETLVQGAVGSEMSQRQMADLKLQTSLETAVSAIRSELALKADKSAITAAVADEASARQDADDALTAAFTAVTAAGAKNSLENTNAAGIIAIRSLQFTVNGDGSIDVGAGTVTGGNADLHINANAESELIVGATYILSGCPDGGSTTGYRVNISGKGADTGNGLVFTYDGGQIDVYIRISSGYTVTNTLHFEPMIRRAEITDGTFRPYAPTNRRLYEMILTLLSGASVQSVASPMLAQAGRANIPEVTGDA